VRENSLRIVPVERIKNVDEIQPRRGVAIVPQRFRVCVRTNLRVSTVLGSTSIQPPKAAKYDSPGRKRGVRREIE